MCESGLALEKSEAGAPEDEIEVTPAMIDAGLNALWVTDRRLEMEEKMMERVFRAMLAASTSTI
jgi:hypothetical protein